MKRQLLFILLFGINFFLLQAQHKLKGSDIDMNIGQLKGLDNLFSEFEVFKIDLVKLNTIVSNGNETQLDWQIGNKHQYSLSLYNKDIRSLSYRESLSVSDTNIEFKPVGKSKTYRGQTGDGGFVRLTITHDFIYGIIETKNGLMVIDQLKYVLNNKNIPSNQLIIYSYKDVKQTDGFCDTVDKVFEKTGNKTETEIIQRATTNCMILEVATDADFEYFQEYGGDSNDRILAEFNNIEGIYATTFDLEIVIVHQNVWTTINDPYVSTSGSTINSEIGNTWQTTFGNVKRDLTHMFTGKDLGGLLGRTSGIGNVCVDANANSFTVDVDESNSYTVAHEIGHNLGAVHPNGDPNSFCGGTDLQRTVMCQGGNIANIVFSAFSQNQINNFISENSACLFEFDYISSILGNNNICVNNSDAYTLNVPNEANITWSLSNSNARIVSGQGTTTITIEGLNFGSVNLTASVDFVCQDPTLVIQELWIGEPIISSNDVFVRDSYYNNLSGSGTYSDPYIVCNGEEYVINMDSNNVNSINYTTIPSGWTSYSYGVYEIAFTPNNMNYGNTYAIDVDYVGACGNSVHTMYFKKDDYCFGGYFKVVPNPITSTELTILKKGNNETKAFNANYEVEFLLFNDKGVQLKSKKDLTNKKNYTLNIPNLKNGMYYLKVITEKHTEVHRILVDR
ncbi:zinc-dependent metalloprotease family protein [Hwangdonia seohaensis]|uniref:Zinc-dependent metalloprotease family protein n=1 Tax=Hwangdonia seohaensis TaxID=1240727 RepID=A0ABW3R7C0_9FLAO